MKRKNNHIKSFLLIAIAAVITSCSSVKYLKEKESLLIKNRIQSDNILVNKDEVVTYMRQKPNRTILGFIPLKLWIYNWVNPEKEEARDFKRERKLIEINKKREAKGKKPTTKSYFTKWLLKNGEAPAILDTSLSINTADIIKKYIISKGFFNAEVTSNIEYKKRKKAIVTYEITTHKPWLIKSITYASSDTNLLNYVLSDTSSSLIKPAMLCDFDVLDYERERIASNLQQHGFYYFNKDFISYRLDSANKDNSVTVLALIKKNTYKLSGDDNIYTENHKQYAIHNIYVYSDYPIKPIKDAPADTLVHSVLRQKKNLGDSIYFIHQILKINPSVLSYAITIKQNETYAKQSAEQTIARLTSLKVFKFVNVNFLDITKDSILNPYGRNLLDARIQLNRSPVHVLTLQGEGTNSSGNFGVAANIVYQNRNLFKGAEIFSFKLNGSMEIQQLFTATTATNNYLFNTFETSFETGLEIPRFLLPMRQERFSKSFRPTTNIQLGLNYQFRPDYNRTIARVSFGYD